MQTNREESSYLDIECHKSKRLNNQDMRIKQNKSTAMEPSADWNDKTIAANNQNESFYRNGTSKSDYLPLNYNDEKVSYFYIRTFINQPIKANRI